MTEIIEERIGKFLQKQVKEHNVNFDEVEIGMKLQDNDGVYSSYYYLRVKKVFVRYIKISELL